MKTRVVCIERPNGSRFVQSIDSKGAGEEVLAQLRAELKALCRANLCTGIVVTIHSVDENCDHGVPS